MKKPWKGFLSRIIWATAYTISPQSVMTTVLLTLPDLHPNFSIFFTVAKLSPMSASFPKTTCLPDALQLSSDTVCDAYRQDGVLASWWWRTGSSWCPDQCLPWTAGRGTHASHQSSRPRTCSRRLNSLRTRPLVQSPHPVTGTSLSQIKDCRCPHLQHEVWNDPVNLWSLISKTRLPRAKLFEVVNCPVTLHWTLLQQLEFSTLGWYHQIAPSLSSRLARRLQRSQRTPLFFSFSLPEKVKWFAS